MCEGDRCGYDFLRPSCMEKRDLSQLREKFPEALEGKRIVCLGIPDEYGYMDPDLIDLLRDALAPHVEVP